MAIIKGMLDAAGVRGEKISVHSNMAGGCLRVESVAILLLKCH